MTAEISSRPGLPGRLREDGYDIPPGLPFERWQEIGATLQQMHRSINWWIGDWLRYGEANYGEDAYQAVKLATGRGDESLSQVTWVAARFPAGTRVPELSWSHHRAVLLDDLPMAESHRLLEQIKDDPIPVRDLSDRARTRREQLRGQVADAPPEELAAPTRADLTPDALAALSVRLSGVGRRHAIGYEAGWLACLSWLEADDCFTKGEARR
jgi:hypothetical protein